MELVYLWVEEYKNIHKQGFNFSPKFNCNYDPDTNELTIEENDDYIENFFGENINVTAIVGKNGSGKSSLLEIILEILASRLDIWAPSFVRFVFVYIYDKELCVHSNTRHRFSTNTHLVLKNYPNADNLLDYYEDTIAIYMNSEYREPESRHTQALFSENNKYDKNSSNIALVENNIKNKTLLDNIKEKIFTPCTLSIKTKMADNGIQSILYEDRDYYSDDDWKEIQRLISSIKSRESNFIDSLKTIKNIFELKYRKHKNRGEYTFFDDKKSPDKYKNFNPTLLRNIPDIFLSIKSEPTNINLADIDEAVLLYINKLPYIFEIDLIDNNGTKINDLSFGEKQLLFQLHYILKYTTSKTYDYYVPPYQMHNEYGEPEGDEQGDYYKKIDIQSCLIFLDEFEIGLHPEWQKKTIKYIIDFLEVVDIKTHLILTSHSPFLLSDIPKQNIIFLDTDEEGKCVVVDGLKEKKQTFGANIHTLLSDSFFMEDGLMGEFAKGKIDKAIALLNQEYLSDEDLKYCEQIISIIGEPIVKNQLQRMLDSKRLKKIDEIEENIQALQEELEKLKNAKS